MLVRVLCYIHNIRDDYICWIKIFCNSIFYYYWCTSSTHTYTTYYNIALFNSLLCVSLLHLEMSHSHLSQKEIVLCVVCCLQKKKVCLRTIHIFFIIFFVFFIPSTMTFNSFSFVSMCKILSPIFILSVCIHTHTHTTRRHIVYTWCTHLSFIKFRQYYSIYWEDTCNRTEWEKKSFLFWFQQKKKKSKKKMKK